MRSSVSCTAFSCAILDDRPGILVLEVSGKRVESLFSNEAGGHRWQRVPPNERHGRRHTSTVTVAVLPIEDAAVARIHERDIEWQATRGSGAGGQARNKTSNAVQMRHKPTGVAVRVESERSQTLNRESAFRLLAARISGAERDKKASARAGNRQAQIGSGQRGDKRRTIRMQDGTVTDHVTGKRWELRRYLRGELL